MSFTVLPFTGDLALAQAAADGWLDQLAARNPARAYTVAISGGRIARVFFAAVARGAITRGASFSKVHFFWADERCVPPDHPESNYLLARQTLFDPLAIPLDQIHRLRGEDPEELALARAVAEITAHAPVNAAGQPVLDLVFLGMGEEGHVASLFPGEPEEIAGGPAIYRAVTTPKPPPRRFTLGYAALAAASEVWMLASGKGKEAALRESLSPAGGTPFGRVVKSRSQTRIFTDLIF